MQLRIGGSTFISFGLEERVNSSGYKSKSNYFAWIGKIRRKDRVRENQMLQKPNRNNFKFSARPWLLRRETFRSTFV